MSNYEQVNAIFLHPNNKERIRGMSLDELQLAIDMLTIPIPEHESYGLLKKGFMLITLLSDKKISEDPHKQAMVRDLAEKHLQDRANDKEKYPPEFLLFLRTFYKARLQPNIFNSGRYLDNVIDTDTPYACYEDPVFRELLKKYVSDVETHVRGFVSHILNASASGKVPPKFVIKEINNYIRSPEEQLSNILLIVTPLGYRELPEKLVKLPVSNIPLDEIYLGRNNVANKIRKIAETTEALEPLKKFHESLEEQIKLINDSITEMLAEIDPNISLPKLQERIRQSTSYREQGRKNEEIARAIMSDPRCEEFEEDLMKILDIEEFKNEHKLEEEKNVPTFLGKYLKRTFVQVRELFSKNGVEHPDVIEVTQFIRILTSPTNTDLMFLPILHKKKR